MQRNIRETARGNHIFTCDIVFTLLFDAYRTETQSDLMIARLFKVTIIKNWLPAAAIS